MDLQLPIQLRRKNGLEEKQQQKLPIMCIGEYTHIARCGRNKAKIVMTPFLYYPEVDCFYVDLPDDYEAWEESKKKEHFIEQLNDNSDYLNYSDKKMIPGQLGALFKDCHQGKLLKALLNYFNISHESAHEAIITMTDKFLNTNWNEKSLVVPSKSIFVDRSPEGKLKFIIYQMTLIDYAQLRTVEDFLQHRINFLQDDLLINDKEEIVAVLLGTVLELSPQEDKWEDIAYGMDILLDESDDDCGDHVCEECRVRRARQALSEPDETT